MSLRSRVIWVGMVALLGGMLAYSSFFTEQQRLDSEWIPDKGINLGLDLQGGIHWLLRIDTDTALRQELDKYMGDLEQLFEAQGITPQRLVLNDSLQIELGGVGRPELDRLLADNFGNLEVSEGAGVLLLSLTDDWARFTIDRGVSQAVEVISDRVDDGGIKEPVVAAQGADRILVQLAGDVDPKRARGWLSTTTFLEFYHVIDAAQNSELLRAKYPEGLPEANKIVVSRSDLGDEVFAYLVGGRPILTGDMLRDARVGFDRRNRPLVQFEWDNEGTALFREYSGKNIGNVMAIVIDGKVLSAPTIQDRIGRNGQITGAFSQQDAADLAMGLRSGSLPIPLVIEEERTVGPALGQDSIDQGLRSITIGLLLVLGFMALYYRSSGVLANVALVLNIVLVLGAMSFAGATLTLPGMAGLVLTVGMAVDANVIIFEHIREEIRSGKVIRTAVEEGFRRSRLTILDANITTLLTALILYYFGRGPIQGFGVTLSIGIISSVFCALIVTRLLVDLVMARSTEALKF